MGDLGENSPSQLLEAIDPTCARPGIFYQLEGHAVDVYHVTQAEIEPVGERGVSRSERLG